MIAEQTRSHIRQEARTRGRKATRFKSSSVLESIDAASSERLRCLVTAEAESGGRYSGQVNYWGTAGFFVESQALPPLGTEVTVKVVEPDGVEESSIQTGIVQWICPFADLYGNKKGFAVSMRSSPIECGARLLEHPE